MTTTPTLDDDFEVALDSMTFDDLDDDTPVEPIVVASTPEPEPEPEVDPMDDEADQEPEKTLPGTKPRFQLAPTQEGNLEMAADTASANLLMAQQELARRFAENPMSFSLKNLIDVGEHSYKVSGMAKKQEQKEENSKFILNINFSGGKNLRIEKTVDGSSSTDDAVDVLSEQANMLVSEIDVSEGEE